MTLQDKSNYLKGLLILIGKDKIISKEEERAILQLGKILGFDTKFCQDAINELLENKYIIEEAPKFSSKEVAISFLTDGINLACADGNFHLSELSWLISVAEKNEIDKLWCIKKIDSLKAESKNTNGELEFEITKLLTQKAIGQ
ncbi:hypothetical protein ABRY23_08755 [Melioribacteraceae bacterium 4301-Me]|uniref:hypothetical protein n=1 Tax=Pyranulibacter aquaticus TaxID=3163344 RepID=UPI00359A417A